MAGPVGKKRFRVSSSVVGAAGALEQQNLPLLWKDRSGGGRSGSRASERRQADEGGDGGGGGGGAQGGAGSRVLRQLSYPLLSGLNAGCERRRGITADAVNPVVRGQVALRK